MEKKTWTEPELSVLVRSKPEEAVLGGCKVFSSGIFDGPYSNAKECYQYGACAFCYGNGLS